RLRIDPAEVTPAERATLESSGVSAPSVQAFLAWRRSVLFVVALGFLPVVGLEIYDASRAGDGPEVLTSLGWLQVTVHAAFALLLWTQLPRWTAWRRQRRVLTAGWFFYFLTPFALYLYPRRTAFGDALGQGVAAGDPTAAAMGPLFGMLASLGVMLDLAPKAVSLLPGLLRGAITSKLLFPGASGPGWLVLLMAPIYAVLMYLVLMVPYQLTASGYFVVAMVGLIGAQMWLGRMGYRLAR